MKREDVNHRGGGGPPDALRLFCNLTLSVLASLATSERSYPTIHIQKDTSTC